MKRLICFGLAAVTAVSLAGCGKDDKAQGEIDTSILVTKDQTYRTTTAKVESISSTYVADGKYGYPYKSTLVIKTNGIVEKFAFDPAEQVSAGDLLLKINSDEIDAQIETQQIRLDAAKATLDKVNAQSSSAKEKELAEIDYEIEQNKMDLLLSDRENYELHAESDGIVDGWMLDETFKKGNSVYAGQIFAEMPDRSRKVICTEIYGEKLNNVEFGTKVVMTQGATTANGRVTDIMYVDAGEYSRYIYVVVPDEGEPELFDFADIRLSFKVFEKSDVVIVPEDAVITVGNRTFVYVLVNGIKLENDVELGILDQLSGSREILSGLEGNEELVLN